MSAEALLPNLVGLYQRGLLVPFIGSGMSSKVCTDWPAFLIKLAELAGLNDEAEKIRSTEAPNTAQLYRSADRVVHAMQSLTSTDRAKRYREALQKTPGTHPDIPSGILALTDGLYWPLVLTTNYDDLYWAACNERPTRHGKQLPLVLGRELEDCHLVLRSLDRIAPPLLWALQGFLAGQRSTLKTIIPKDERRREALERQVVVGHQQYQQAINGDAHFRRAFAEVFRRRSLLFIGSGILEEYLLNLFSEIIYNHGASAYPHIALLNESERGSRFDEGFLQTRLGIKPIFWKDPQEIETLLRSLKEASKPHVSDAPASGKSTFLQSRTYCIGSVSVTLAFKTVSTHMEAGSGVAFSSGRKDNKPRLGSFGKEYLSQVKKDDLPHLWHALDSDTSAFVFQYESEPIFAIAARGTEDNKSYRDLGVIADAVQAALDQIAHQGLTKVYLGAIAAGRSPQDLWHPIHPFAQTLRGIRRFVSEGRINNLREIEVCVIDPRIWAMILSEKLPVQDMLTAESVPLLVELHRDDGRVETYNLLITDGSTIGEVLAKCQINPAHWKITVEPRRTASEEPEESPDQIVTATMTLIVVKPPLEETRRNKLAS